MNRTIAILFFLLSQVSALSAQDSLRISKITSLRDAWGIAFDHNPDYENYQLNQQKAEMDFKASRSYRFPTVTAGFDGQRNLALATTPIPGEIFGEPEGTTINAQFGQEYNYNAGISISKSIVDRQKVLQSKLSKLNVKHAEAQLEAYRQLLKQQVNLHYYAAMIAKRAMVISQKDMEVADSIVLLSGQKFEEGVIDAITVNQAKINVNFVKQAMINNQLLFDQNISELKKLFGMHPADSLILLEELAYEFPDHYRVEDLPVDPEIALSSISEQQADLQVSLQKSLFVPKLSLSSYYGTQQFREDFGLSFDNDAWNNFSYIGLNISVPIFTGFKNKNQYKSSKVAQKIAQNELEKTRLSASINDKLLVNEYNRSRQNARAALETFGLYEENRRLTYQKYTEGLLSLDHYLSVFEDYMEAENTFLNALSNTYGYYSQIISRTE